MALAKTKIFIGGLILGFSITYAMTSFAQLSLANAIEINEILRTLRKWEKTGIKCAT